MEFTVCVLLYGDYPRLARRLLASLSRPVWRNEFSLRVGLNAVSDATRRVLAEFKDFADVTYFEGHAPYYKYPLMRQMLHQVPVETTYLMWFDDDSWILPTAADDWFLRVARALTEYAVVGVPYVINLRGNQHLWIEDQSWFAGEPVAAGSRITFITGGWLALVSGIVQQYDWPSVDISHNGGDVMLGALCQQQKLRLGKFTEGVAVNASDSGRCSSAPRRGASLSPVGVDYVRGSRMYPRWDYLQFFDGRTL